MSRKPRISQELVLAAREAARNASSADELRAAQTILLSDSLHLTLDRIGAVIGRSRSTAARLRAGFREMEFSEKSVRKRNWGGRRRFHLTLEEEESLLSEFLDTAQGGGILEVGSIREACEKKVGGKVAKTTVYRMLARHGWRKIVPRKRHPKTDVAAQEAFKKNYRRSSPRK
jgi:transposase